MRGHCSCRLDCTTIRGTIPALRRPKHCLPRLLAPISLGLVLLAASCQSFCYIDYQSHFKQHILVSPRNLSIWINICWPEHNWLHYNSQHKHYHLIFCIITALLDLNCTASAKWSSCFHLTVLPQLSSVHQIFPCYFPLFLFDRLPQPLPPLLAQGCLAATVWSVHLVASVRVHVCLSTRQSVSVFVWPVRSHSMATLHSCITHVLVLLSSALFPPCALRPLFMTTPVFMAQVTVPEL